MRAGEQVRTDICCKLNCKIIATHSGVSLNEPARRITVPRTGDR
jgi:transketolase C-terminal domain/subunit